MKKKITAKTMTVTAIFSFLVLIIIAFMSVYFVRLLDPYNDIVYVDVHKSIIYKLFMKF